MTVQRAYRNGVADACTGKEYCNPFKWNQVRHLWAYFNGFMDGAERMAANA